MGIFISLMNLSLQLNQFYRISKKKSLNPYPLLYSLHPYPIKWKV